VKTVPEELKGELQTLGRSRYNRLRKVAAMLHYYRIDSHTIADRLVERGSSRELAEWIIQTASVDPTLARQVEEADAPEATTQVLLKGLNGVALLAIVGLLGRFVQAADSLPLLFVLTPFLIVFGFVGFFMTMRMVFELKRRANRS